MIFFKLIITGVVMGFLSALPVGPSALEIVRRGCSYGYKQAFLVGLGTLTSDILYSMLAVFGVSKFIIGNNIAQEITGSIAAIVIAAFGIYIIYESKKERSAEKQERKELPAYVSGVALTIFNPFVLLFWAGIVSIVYSSPLVDGAEGRAALFIIAAILGILIWTIILAYLSSLGKLNLSGKYRKLLNIIIGSVLILASVVILIRLFT
jgi:threonine/homoserine/homoserine lactone efflux protein